MQSLGKLVIKLMEVFSVVIMSVMAVMVFANVVLRYTVNSSITSSEELSRYLFVWLTFVAAILAYLENQHIAVNFIMEKFHIKIQKAAKIVVDLLILLCCSLIIRGSWLLTELGVYELSPVTMIPMSYVYISGVIGGCGLFLICLGKIYTDIRE